jgi:hypothetical protein
MEKSVSGGVRGVSRNGGERGIYFVLGDHSEVFMKFFRKTARERKNESVKDSGRGMR